MPRLFALAVLAFVVGLHASAPWAAPVVPRGFEIREIARPGTETLQDVLPGRGAYGDYLYYADLLAIWRVSPQGGAPQLFATLAPTDLTVTVMAFGFGGDLYAVTDGGNDGPARFFRVLLDGTYSKFGPELPWASEGLAYSAGGQYGNNLYASEFDNCAPVAGGGYGNPISAIDSGGSATPFVRIANNCSRLTGLAFSRGGEFGERLYGIDTNGATVYAIEADGTYRPFLISPALDTAETLAFGAAGTAFGSLLYIARDFSGDLYRVNAAGEATVFASGFAGFRYEGVSGLKFSEDGRTLFVTDDRAGVIYAIQAVPEPSIFLLLMPALIIFLLPRKRAHCRHR